MWSKERSASSWFKKWWRGYPKEQVDLDEEELDSLKHWLSREKFSQMTTGPFASGDDRPTHLSITWADFRNEFGESGPSLGMSEFGRFGFEPSSPGKSGKSKKSNKSNRKAS